MSVLYTTIMNLKKLAKYFTGDLPNSKAIPIADFVNILENNLNIDYEDIKNWKHLSWAVISDYKRLLEYVSEQKDGEWVIWKLLEYFELPNNFLIQKDFSSYITTIPLEVSDPKLLDQKKLLYEELDELLKKLKSSKNNKDNWNQFENFAEKFLLQSSYFEKGFKELAFEDWTEKIDRLMRLNKDIWNFWKNTWYLWYTILEAKYKKEAKNSASEVPQIVSYAKRLHKYGIAKYAIVITSTKHKNTYLTQLWDYAREKVIEKNPFYFSLITIEDIQSFLSNEWNYVNMCFDEYIERSFIKWLK